VSRAHRVEKAQRISSAGVKNLQRISLKRVFFREVLQSQLSRNLYSAPQEDSRSQVYSVGLHKQQLVLREEVSLARHNNHQVKHKNHPSVVVPPVLVEVYSNSSHRVKVSFHREALEA